MTFSLEVTSGRNSSCVISRNCTGTGRAPINSRSGGGEDVNPFAAALHIHIYILSLITSHFSPPWKCRPIRARGSDSENDNVQGRGKGRDDVKAGVAQRYHHQQRNSQKKCPQGPRASLATCEQTQVAPMPICFCLKPYASTSTKTTTAATNNRDNNGSSGGSGGRSGHCDSNSNTSSSNGGRSSSSMSSTRSNQQVPLPQTRATATIWRQRLDVIVNPPTWPCPLAMFSARASYTRFISRMRLSRMRRTCSPDDQKQNVEKKTRKHQRATGHSERPTG